MKKSVYQTTIILLMACVLTLAGCQTTSVTTGTTTTATTAGTTTASQTTTTVETEPEIVTIEITFIATDMTFPDFDEDIFRHEIENRLAVHIEPSALIYATQDDYNKRLTLLAASAEWPEMLVSPIFAFTTSVLNTAGEAGFLHDFTEDLAQPGREAYVDLADVGIAFNKNPNDGKLYKLPANVSGHADYAPASAAVNLRMDLLEKLDVKFPQNPDEFYDLLVKIKEEGEASDGSEMIPLSLPEGVLTGQGWTSYMLFNNWLQNNEWEIDPNTGTFIRPIWSNYKGFEELCVYFNKLYNEGLLDRETFIQKNDQLQQKMATGKVGVSSLAYWTLGSINNSLEQVDPDMFYGYMPPFPNPETVTQYRGNSYWNGGYAVVAVNNRVSDEKLKAMWRMMDYLITEEGTVLLHYGIEGETCSFHADGYYDYTDDVKAKVENDSGYLKKMGLKLYHTFLHNYPFYHETVSPENNFIVRRDYRQMAEISRDYEGVNWERTIEAFYVDAGPVESARDSNLREAQAELFVQAVTAKTADEARTLAQTWPGVAENLGIELIYQEKMDLVENR